MIEPTVVSLARLQRQKAYFESAGQPTAQMQIHWQKTMEAIEGAFASINATITEIAATQEGLEEAQAALEVTQATLTAAVADIAAAQAAIIVVQDDVTDLAALETVADHEAKPDPHSQYLTDAEGDAAYAPIVHGHVAADISGLATVATSGSFADLTGKPGVRSNGQFVLSSTTTLGSTEKGCNLLITTAGITLTFPASGYANGEGVAVSNVSGGAVSLAFPGGSDIGGTLLDGGTFFAFCDGGGFWRQYCYSAVKL